MKVGFAHLKCSRTDTASDKISFENKSTQRLRAFYVYEIYMQITLLIKASRFLKTIGGYSYL